MLQFLSIFIQMSAREILQTICCLLLAVMEFEASIYAIADEYHFKTRVNFGLNSIICDRDNYYIMRYGVLSVTQYSQDYMVNKLQQTQCTLTTVTEAGAHNSVVLDLNICDYISK